MNFILKKIIFFHILKKEKNLDFVWSELYFIIFLEIFLFGNNMDPKFYKIVNKFIKIL